MLFAGCAEDHVISDANSGDEDPLLISSFGSDSTFSVVTWNVKYFPKQGVNTINLIAEIIVDLNVYSFGL